LFGLAAVEVQVRPHESGLLSQPVFDLALTLSEISQDRDRPHMPRFTRVEGGAYFFLPGTRGRQAILRG
jgi:hypothetical protein